eukprot:scaffold31548_cov114-Isochrysis_galbana.AAC.2
MEDRADQYRPRGGWGGRCRPPLLERPGWSLHPRPAQLWALGRRYSLGRSTPEARPRAPPLASACAGTCAPRVY